MNASLLRIGAPASGPNNAGYGTHGGAAARKPKDVTRRSEILRHPRRIVSLRVAKFGIHEHQRARLHEENRRIDLPQYAWQKYIRKLPSSVQHPGRRNNVKKILLATAMSVVCLSSAHATNYRFFCTNQSDPTINPDHDGVFVAITYGTVQSFDVVHAISKQLYNRQVQYRVTSITHPASDSYFWEGFMLKDPHVIMTGHLWENEGVWMYAENQKFTDGRPPKLATPPVVCHNTVDLRQAIEREDEQPTVPPGTEPPNPHQNTPPPLRYSQAPLPNCNDQEVVQVVKKLTSTRIIGSVNSAFVDMMTVDQTQGMGINNNNESKYCRALFRCDMNVAREAERGVYGQHPLQAACYRFNQAADSGNPAWIQFELRPDGSGGWLTTIIGSN
jgi:hypothetical protein